MTEAIKARRDRRLVFAMRIMCVRPVCRERSTLNCGALRTKPQNVVRNQKEKINLTDFLNF